MVLLLDQNVLGDFEYAALEVLFSFSFRTVFDVNVIEKQRVKLHVFT